MRVLLTLLAILLFAASSLAATSVPAPFTATYAVKYRGVRVGEVRVELRAGEGGEYVYENRAIPARIARLFVRGDAVERSVMRIDDAGVRPLSWSTEDGTAKTEHDGSLVFDWAKGVVRGVVEDEAVELPAEPGLQDRLSTQVAVLTALLRGQEPGTIPMVSKKRIRHYSYTRSGAERVRTAAGEFDVVRFESTRPGSVRRSVAWFAPRLGYVTVRAEQWREGKLETEMELVEVAGRFGEAPPEPAAGRR